MDLLTYINSYHNCAINNVPTEKLKEWYVLYPEVGLADPQGFHNVRFLDGKYISYYTPQYPEGSVFAGGILERVIDYIELLDVTADDDDFYFNDIL